MKKSTRRNIFEIRRKELYCYGMIHKQKNIQFLKKIITSIYLEYKQILLRIYGICSSVRIV